jgi:hypothetical protein
MQREFIKSLQSNLRSTVRIGLVAALALPAWGQAPKPVEFEVASIRLFDPTVPGQAAGLHFDGAQVRGVGLSLRDYLATAYRSRGS